MNLQINICIIGAGNLAWSLIPALQQAGYHINQLISRSENSLILYADTYGISSFSTEIQELHPDVDMILLTINDQAIDDVIEQLPNTNAILLHHSGTTPLASLQRFFPRTGVLYPLQSFTRHRSITLGEVPLFWEGTPTSSLMIRHMAESLSSRVYYFSSAQRLRLHAAAVWINNFTNLMYRIGDSMLLQDGTVDFTVFEPMIREHIDKILTSSPQESQTGPAIRGDSITIRKHLDLMQDQPQLRDLYLLLSRLINPKLDEL